MHCLNIRFMVKSDNAYIFTFHKLHKSWRMGKGKLKLYFYKYPKDQELCVVSALNEYHGGQKVINFSYFYVT